MGCVNSTQKVQLSQDDLESILAIYPGDWSQAQVLRWLQLTHDGDLSDLVEPFRKEKISGVTFVKLTKQMLKDELDVKQFGLRDGFISARDKVLERFPDKSSINGASESKAVVNANNNNNNNHNMVDGEQQHDASTALQLHTTAMNLDGSLAENADLPKVDDSHNHHSSGGGGVGSGHHIMDPTPHKGEESMLSNATSTQHGHFGARPNGVVQHASSFLDDTATNYTNQTASNNGGYETIDLFSPSAMPTPAGFSNMPANSFQQPDDMAQEEDQYAKIDYADLNNPDPPMSTRVLSNAQSVQRFESVPNNMPNTAMPFSFHTQSMYSPQLVNAAAPSTSAHVTPNLDAQATVAHHHNQTGSNYDDLPLEFINDFNANANASAAGSGGTGATGMMLDGGYQEIQFGDVDDNISSQPSVHDSSFATNQGQIHVGQIIQFEDAHANQWLEGEVELVDLYRGSVRVKCMKPPRTTMVVALHKIRVLSPPPHDALAQLQLHNASQAQSAQIHANGSAASAFERKGVSVGAASVAVGVGGATGATGMMYANPLNEMSAHQKEIHEFARELWKTLHRIEVKTITDDNNEPLRGFSGKELIRHVRNRLKAHVRDKSDKEVVILCGDLVKYQYIRLIASVAHNGGSGVSGGSGTNSGGSTQLPGGEAFTDSDKFLYQFENEKHREFIKDDQPDRRAWTRGTKVQIYSATLNGWQPGTVVEVNNDTLTITYGRSNQQMRKTLDRYQDDLVKSTTQFVEQRKAWQKLSEVEVYSHGQHIWCLGRIDEVLPAKEQQPVDIFRVFYTNNDDKDFSKYVDRWSPDLRDVQQLSPKLAKYKKGTKVKVWSNSKQNWIAGVVIDVVPTYEVVNVRYGDHEKLVPVSSDDIKLFDDDDQTPMN
eukprot:CAMPEP_0202710850 /NCGR_PEP_ID=MMETSP1385-20130828/22758_1 /ASSEMBLY_ACC=CAM_ASM_000861 /TAXON_ID=933848 /ORGANISM="Elphidium margaritaceum" /LENGTH=885 /DNA_ID=CAMNT_0049370467 /DNA_START=33 /DNA_END=2690 /DNA_ORIENTATION=-